MSYEIVEGIVTKTHETISPQKENVLYFEVSNFNDEVKAGAERVVYRVVFSPSSSTSSSPSSSTSLENILPIHFGDKVIFKGKVPFSEDDKAIVKGKIIEWNSIHPKSKPFFVACSSLDFIRNHIKNIFKDSDEKMVENILESFQKASKEEGLKTVSSYLTFCSCKYVFLRENEDVSPNVNSMISKERFTKTVETEREKRFAASKTKERGASSKKTLSSSKASSSKTKSLIFSGVLNPFDDVSSAFSSKKKGSASSPPVSKAAEFIISITESKHFKPSAKGPYILTPRQLELLLVTWNRDNCLRPFNLLGLTKADVKECAKNQFLRNPPSIYSSTSSSPSGRRRIECKECEGFTFPWCGFCSPKPLLPSGTFDYEDLISLYERIVECPFAFKAISMKKAIDIFHSHNPSSVSSVPKDHLFCGHFLRKLDEEKNSTCIELTGSSFEESFKENEKMLKCVYGVLTYDRPDGRRFAYLYERFKIEKAVAKFISDCVVRSEQVNDYRRENRIVFDSEEDEEEEDDVFGVSGSSDKIVLTEEQKNAVEAIVSSTGCPFPCIITITGGPGVGKTTILKEVIRRFKDCKATYRVSSFTGKAVSRIKEKTQCRAKFASTLDRLIAKNDVFSFEHLIIDEASMVTSQLLYRFLSARKAASSTSSSVTPPLKITFIGDPDQLPPIEWGNLFSILLSFPNEWISSFRLSAGFRLVGDASTLEIQKAFEAIRNSSPTELRKLISDGGVADSSLSIIENARGRGFEDVVNRIKHIRDVYKDAVDASMFGVFSPFNQDVNAFNDIIRGVFAENVDVGEEKSKKDGYFLNKFEVGDRVIMTKNIYFPDEDQDDASDDEEDDADNGGGFAYMNGDTGVVVDTNEAGIFVDFDTGPQKVFFQWETPSRKALNEAADSSPDLKMKAFEEDLKGILLKTGDEWSGDGDGPGADEDFVGGSRGALPLKDKILFVDLLKLAFSLTVHKSQGSEYDHVIVHIPFVGKRIPSSTETRSFINRNLLYTALTRTRKTVTIITPGTFENEITSAILSKPPLRYGNLGHRVVDCLFERDFHHLIVAKDDEKL